MKLSKTQRETIRLMFGGKCAYCGHDLGGRWHADHVVSVQRIVQYVQKESYKWVGVLVGMRAPENDRLENFFPSCVPCNIHKSDMTLDEWRTYLERQVEMARRSSAPFRHALRFGQVTINTEPIMFYFEKHGKEQ